MWSSETGALSAEKWRLWAPRCSDAESSKYFLKKLNKPKNLLNLERSRNVNIW